MAQLFDGLLTSLQVPYDVLWCDTIAPAAGASHCGTFRFSISKQPSPPQRGAKPRKIGAIMDNQFQSSPRRRFKMALVLRFKIFDIYPLAIRAFFKGEVLLFVCESV